MAFYVGQKVARYRDGNLPELRVSDPPIGEPVTITRIWKHWIGEAIDLAEYPDRCGYNAAVFRPIVSRPTSISIFTAMLGPTKVREEA